MKKIKSTFLVLALLAFLLNITVSLACPTTNCNADCGNGRICSITQYVNGVLCSTTVCHGKGAIFVP